MSSIERDIKDMVSEAEKELREVFNFDKPPIKELVEVAREIELWYDKFSSEKPLFTKTISVYHGSFPEERLHKALKNFKDYK